MKATIAILLAIIASCICQLYEQVDGQTTNAFTSSRFTNLPTSPPNTTLQLADDFTVPKG